jgi:hypothetical protein
MFPPTEYILPPNLIIFQPSSEDAGGACPARSEASEDGS